MRGQIKQGQRVACAGPSPTELTGGGAWEGEGPLGLEGPTAAQKGGGGQEDHEAEDRQYKGPSCLYPAPCQDTEVHPPRCLCVG